MKELEQEKIILKEIYDDLEKKNQKLQNSKEKLENNLENEIHKSKELEQEKILLKEVGESERNESQKTFKKYYKTVAIFGVILAVTIGAYSVYTTHLIGQQYAIKNLAPAPTGYVIQNLQGDTINTWLSWGLTSGTIIHVNVINSDRFPGKIDLIKDVIDSEEKIQVDDSLIGNGPKGTTSTFYKGWKGALEQASEKPTKFYIPTSFDVMKSDTGVGDITIKLTDEESGDGYSGYTKSIADGAQNQILKSTITIYNVDHIGNNQFETILRHEFGHAMGLAHSSAPEDLMHATIQGDYPYISECDIDTVSKLYDGSKESQVVCEK